MDPTRVRRTFSKRGAAALVYVTVALLVVGASAQMSGSNLQWFTSTRELTVDIQLAELKNLDTQTPSVLVQASLGNPSGLSGIKLEDITYDVFANSTTTTFAYIGNSEIGKTVTFADQTIPIQGTMNITRSVPVFSEVRLALQNFTNSQGANFRIIAGITLSLSSPFGPFDIPYCYEMPGQTLTLCPPTRTYVPPSTAAGGGGR